MVDFSDVVEMDPIEVAVTGLIEKGKKQGFLTWEELNRTLPDEAISPDKLEVVMMRLEDAGIEMVDESEAAQAGQ